MTTANRTTREQFMGRIREALKRKAGDTVPAAPAVPDELVRLAGPGDDLLALFEKRATEVGMSVIRVPAVQVPEAVTALLEEAGAKRITAALPRLPQSAAILAAIEARGVKLETWRNDATMANHYTADAGVSDVHAALAETGSIVCCGGAEHGRAHSLVVPIHIAIVRRSDILPDLLDYMASLGGRAGSELPSGQAIITGPSKTADIEGVLITGIHGPFKVFIVLVPDA